MLLGISDETMWVPTLPLRRSRGVARRMSNTRKKPKIGLLSERRIDHGWSNYFVKPQN
jgi:hypothetical protein